MTFTEMQNIGKDGSKMSFEFNILLLFNLNQLICMLNVNHIPTIMNHSFENQLKATNQPSF